MMFPCSWMLFLFVLLGSSRAQDLSFTSENGEVTITKYTGTDLELTIPASIEGLPVTAVGIEAFDESNSIIELSIPASVDTIGDSAFRRCRSSTRLNMGKGVTTLGEFAYLYCTDLKRVSIPASVAGCNRLRSLDVAATNPNYSSAAGVRVGCEKISGRLFASVLSS